MAKPVSGGGQGFSAGGVYQHQLQSNVDLTTAMNEAMDVARGSTQPALKQRAIGMVEAFLSSRGVRTSRGADGNLKIEPDSRTAYGRYAMFAAKHCGVSVVVDPTDTAGASYNAQDKVIRVCCHDIEGGKPGLNDLHEMVHACFATSPAADKHPLSGKSYRSKSDVPIWGYERGYSRDEMMAYAIQGQHTVTLQANAVYDKVANGAGNKADLRAIVEMWNSAADLGYCAAFATDIYTSARDLAATVRDLPLAGQANEFVMSADGSRTLMATPHEGTVRISASDSSSGKNMWFYDKALLADRSPAAMVRSFLSAAQTARDLSVKQNDALGRCIGTQKTMMDLLSNDSEPRLNNEERQELLALLRQLPKDLAAVREVTLPRNTLLLPKGFDALEAEIIGAPLAN